MLLTMITISLIGLWISSLMITHHLFGIRKVLNNVAMKLGEKK